MFDLTTAIIFLISLLFLAQSRTYDKVFFQTLFWFYTIVTAIFCFSFFSFGQQLADNNAFFGRTLLLATEIVYWMKYTVLFIAIIGIALKITSMWEKNKREKQTHEKFQTIFNARIASIRSDLGIIR